MTPQCGLLERFLNISTLLSHLWQSISRGIVPPECQNLRNIFHMRFKTLILKPRTFSKSQINTVFSVQTEKGLRTPARAAPIVTYRYCLFKAPPAFSQHSQRTESQQSDSRRLGNGYRPAEAAHTGVSEGEHLGEAGVILSGGPL